MIDLSQKIEIERLYREGDTLRNIAKRFKTRPGNISTILKDRKIRVSSKNCFRTDYCLNHNFFKVIDSELKSYLLGLLFSDGCVATSCNAITLVSNDIELLNLFRNSLECNRPFYINPNHSKATTFTVSSFEMKEHLISFGCVPKKSLVLDFPIEKIDEDLLRHFIRGYFDGDGSIYVNPPLYQFKIISSTRFCEGLSRFFHERLGFRSKVETEPKRYKKETSYIRITKKSNLYKVREYLYKDATYFLNRKKDKFFSF